MSFIRRIVTDSTPTVSRLVFDSLSLAVSENVGAFGDTRVTDDLGVAFSESTFLIAPAFTTTPTLSQGQAVALPFVTTDDTTAVVILCGSKASPAATFDAIQANGVAMDVLPAVEAANLFGTEVRISVFYLNGTNLQQAKDVSATLTFSNEVWTPNRPTSANIAYSITGYGNTGSAAPVVASASIEGTGSFVFPLAVTVGAAGNGMAHAFGDDDFEWLNGWAEVEPEFDLPGVATWSVGEKQFLAAGNDSVTVTSTAVGQRRVCSVVSFPSDINAPPVVEITPLLSESIVAIPSPFVSTAEDTVVALVIADNSDDPVKAPTSIDGNGITMPVVATDVQGATENIRISYFELRGQDLIDARAVSETITFTNEVWTGARPTSQNIAYIKYSVRKSGDITPTISTQGQEDVVLSGVQHPLGCFSSFGGNNSVPGGLSRNDRFNDPTFQAEIGAWGGCILGPITGTFAAIDYGAVCDNIVSAGGKVVLTYINISEVNLTITSRVNAMLAIQGNNPGGASYPDDGFLREAPAGDIVEQFAGLGAVRLPPEYIIPDAQGRRVAEVYIDIYLNDYFAQFTTTTLASGVHFDVFRPERKGGLVNPQGDINHDGVNDAKRDHDWHLGMQDGLNNGLARIRAAHVAGAPHIGNVASWPIYGNEGNQLSPISIAKFRDKLDGGWFEAANKLGGWTEEGDPHVSGSFAIVYDHMENLDEHFLVNPLVGTKVSILVWEATNTSSFRHRRYGLGIALLGGWFLDISELAREFPSHLWFDERFNLPVSQHTTIAEIGALSANQGYLGVAIDPAFLTAWDGNVFRRVFENGIVYVNTGSTNRNDLVPEPGATFQGGTPGWQDPGHNPGGSVGTTFSLDANDAIILMS